MSTEIPVAESKPPKPHSHESQANKSHPQYANMTPEQLSIFKYYLEHNIIQKTSNYFKSHTEKCPICQASIKSVYLHCVKGCPAKYSYSICSEDNSHPIPSAYRIHKKLSHDPQIHAELKTDIEQTISVDDMKNKRKKAKFNLSSSELDFSSPPIIPDTSQSIASLSMPTLPFPDTSLYNTSPYPVIMANIIEPYTADLTGKNEETAPTVTK